MPRRDCGCPACFRAEQMIALVSIINLQHPQEPMRPKDDPFAWETCPQCGQPTEREVSPFSECSECERRVAEENRRNARPMDLSPASPLALRLAESMKDDRRAD
jgi:hypothetical protein